MRWVRKEKKEASPVVDASLQNPQPKCVASSQLTIFIVNALTSQNPRGMPICSPPPTFAGAVTTQSANEDVCDSTTEPGFGAASSSSVTEMIFGLLIPTF